MKALGTVTTLALLGLAGCVTMQPAVPIAPATRTSTAPAVAPVRPEQVTAQNAQKMSQALAEEMDREAQQEITGSSPLAR